ncbi:single-strand DNA-binding protein [Neomicrococcus aestuarii]|uniref:Single-stranded DNA-binding protein n=1 Tax=Neomicrococcus aestuarii TaxID=556325 RepID=A0A7W8TXR6_9MICC|nr:single-stranded DNA-binding protein [Neomicrococcus aestuarii]MBB5513436.1 single-strand DNA-binding protein [Neomicrococcus aestuarii]
MAEIKFTGNLAADAEMKFTKSGVAFLKFRANDSKSRKLENGEWETTASQWLNVDMWDGAEMYAPLLRKGTRVTVYGEFYSREYEGKNGKALSLDVRANAITIHPPRGQRSQQQPANDAWTNQAPAESSGWEAVGAGGFESDAPPF